MFSECLKRRITARVNFEEQPNDDQVETFCRNIAEVAKVLPQFVVVSFVRSLFNAWNTDGRYNKSGSCRWCGVSSADDLRHYLVCSTFLEALPTLFPRLIGQWARRPAPPLLPVLLKGAFCWQVVDHSTIAQCMLAHDLLHFAFCSAKFHHNDGNWRNLFKAKARVWHRFCAGWRSFFDSPLAIQE